ncbi:hypothetical protein [Neisseria meningitidis serogroup B]|uniref:Uncharacterized protein n=1 Tax=Neisseria meningitidis serogroup B TaxID=491 RepID=A0A0H5QDG5_NEIMI|nr:hypothetical protein [Neisseria meningitidis serogroup B]
MINNFLWRSSEKWVSDGLLSFIDNQYCLKRLLPPCRHSRTGGNPFLGFR